MGRETLQIALALVALVGTPSLGWGAVVVDPAYASKYTLADLGSITGLPTNYGGLTFLPNDANTIIIGGAANVSGGKIYQIGVIRGAGNHITGFSGVATPYSDGANNDGGVVFGPGGVLFLARYPLNEIGQIKPGSTATKVASLTPLGVASSIGGFNFVPPGFPGAGQFKVVSYNAYKWYTVALAPDGSGTYNFTGATLQATLSGGPEGFIYVSPGSPLFTDYQSVLVSEYQAGVVSTYQIDSNGDPVVSTRAPFVTGLNGAEGAVTDPVTGDFLFSTFGGTNQVVQVQGFAPPPTTTTTSSTTSSTSTLPPPTTSTTSTSSTSTSTSSTRPPTTSTSSSSTTSTTSTSTTTSSSTTSTVALPSTTTTSTTLPTLVDGFILPRQVVTRRSGTLVTYGTFDTGAQAPDLAAAATVHVGGLTVTVPELTPVGGGRQFRFTRDGVELTVIPAKTHSSKGHFRMTLRGAAGLIDPEGPLTLRFTNPAVDGRGVVTLGGGRFVLGQKPGTLIAPRLYVFRVRARLLGAGADVITVRMGFATDGHPPATAPDLSFTFGDTYHVAVPGSAFVRRGTRFVAEFAGGRVSAVIDYLRETIILHATGADLGAFVSGSQPVRVGVVLGPDVRVNDVRMVRVGKRLRY